jgi:hypothetical protein
MIKVMTERPIPAGFDPSDEAQVARHCRIAVDAFARLEGRAHWLTSYVTEDRLFGVVVLESEADLLVFQRASGMAGQSITVHRVRRQLDPSLAA